MITLFTIQIFTKIVGIGILIYFEDQKLKVNDNSRQPTK